MASSPSPSSANTHDSTSPRKKSNNEEPEMRLEPDVPSDGHDEQGEAMIRDLPKRPELSEPDSTQAPKGSGS